ncbi:MAG: chemotaxis protein CheW [Treponema sp. CETP13]|nr:MAG: chemotaxis protein CheW [Treponema sp. CETP13]
MAVDDAQFQLVTFQLGKELYGVDIMDVKEIVKIQNIRSIPNAPYYVEGIFNLRGEIIPVISLHKRFRIEKMENQSDEDAELNGGFIILNIDNIKISIYIDRIARVVTVNKAEIQAPPQMISGIGSEYIHGVINKDDTYLVVLDTRKLFNPKELQKIVTIDR